MGGASTEIMGACGLGGESVGRGSLSSGSFRVGWVRSWSRISHDESISGAD